MQYGFHCPSTFARLRSVNLVSHLLCSRLPNTGSTVAKRVVIIRSMCARVRRACRTFAVSGGAAGERCQAEGEAPSECLSIAQRVPGMSR